MRQVIFYQVRFAVDRKITGVRDVQVKEIDYGDQEPRKMVDKYQDIYYAYLDDSFPMEIFVADRNARATDVLSSNFLQANGFFISREFKQFLESYRLCNCRFLRTTVRHLSERNEYWYLNMIKCPVVDYAMSQFVVYNNVTREELFPISISSHQHFLQSVNQLKEERGYRFTISGKRIVLEQENDFFQYELSGQKLISQRLKDAIEEQGFTGLVIEPFPVEFHSKD